ncbi:hypothetical protein KIW84_072055 [Lathyrus oleraceus]|uniref:Uncharacterized protein n=1 Tax=Pisum sativum TaxID=3888 RepID=A0A9D4VL29_PEA|nr:hypothetical protein KIW84_072055 [Pisum sativum]
MVKKKGKLTSVVKGVPISLTASDISAILEIPTGCHKFVGTKASFSNHDTITDSEMMLLYVIKSHFRVDWGHTILSHMMSHDEYAKGLPYAHFLTKIFRNFNINMENERCFSMENLPS